MNFMAGWSQFTSCWDLIGVSSRPTECQDSFSKGKAGGHSNTPHVIRVLIRDINITREDTPSRAMTVGKSVVASQTHEIRSDGSYPINSAPIAHGARIFPKSDGAVKLTAYGRKPQRDQTFDRTSLHLTRRKAKIYRR